MDSKQFVDEVLNPTLHELDLYSPEAELLLLGTALIESRLEYVKQRGGGPALSFYQIEPATAEDIWENYLKYKPHIANRIAALMAPGLDKIQQLKGNMNYATAMARVHYMRVKEPLPPVTDLMGMAKYYKKHFNTPLGKSTIEKSLRAFVEAADILNTRKA